MPRNKSKTGIKIGSLTATIADPGEFDRRIRDAIETHLIKDGELERHENTAKASLERELREIDTALRTAALAHRLALPGDAKEQAAMKLEGLKKKRDRKRKQCLEAQERLDHIRAAMLAALNSA